MKQLIITPNWQNIRNSYCNQGVLSVDLPDYSLAYLEDCPITEKICIADLAVVGFNHLSLLKYLENSANDIICVSSKDIFDQVFLSRFDIVTKEPEMLMVYDDSSLLDVLKDRDTGIAKICLGQPQYYKLYYHCLVSRMAKKSKLINILFRNKS
jgi:hypothetical protein